MIMIYLFILKAGTTSLSKVYMIHTNIIMIILIPKNLRSIILDRKEDKEKKADQGKGKIKQEN